jgi:hypothetical protein
MQERRSCGNSIQGVRCIRRYLRVHNVNVTLSCTFSPRSEDKADIVGQGNGSGFTFCTSRPRVEQLKCRQDTTATSLRAENAC